MKKVFLAFIVSVVVLSANPDVSSASRIRLLAPAEESFIGMDQILIIGQVQDGTNAEKVDVSDNDRITGSAPVRKGTFVYSAKLTEGRHEITFTIPGIEPKTIILFVGRQEGYRYHIEMDPGSCKGCHDQAAGYIYSVGPMQEAICLKCHDPLGDSEFVHGPVAAGSCTPCHDPHGSRHDKFLVATGKELCLVCHDQNLSKKHIEERQNAQCIKCHNPHGSSKNYHLR